jgi:hypothetical protein
MTVLRAVAGWSGRVPAMAWVRSYHSGPEYGLDRRDQAILEPGRVGLWVFGLAARATGRSSRRLDTS